MNGLLGDLADNYDDACDSCDGDGCDDCEGTGCESRAREFRRGRATQSSYTRNAHVSVGGEEQ